MARTSIALYWGPFSTSLFCVFIASFFSTVTISSTLLELTRSSAIERTFSFTSRLGEDRARSTSISISDMMSLCFFLRSSRRSKTISLTLLSLCLTNNLQKHVAAARMAVGALDSETNVVAHSYVTAADRLCSSARMILI